MLLSVSRGTAGHKDEKNNFLNTFSNNEQGTDLIDLRQIFREMVEVIFFASEATAASKQLRRSNLTSDLKSVTPITYLSMCTPGGANRGTAGGETCYFSAVCGPIGFKLWWVMGTGHSYLSTRGRCGRVKSAISQLFVGQLG